MTYMQAGAIPQLDGEESTTATSSVTTSAPVLPDGTVNAPIAWDQLIGGWLSDAPVFIVAVLVALIPWLQGDAPITTRGIITIAALAILAGLQAIQRATKTDGLSLRLRARGQLKK